MERHTIVKKRREQTHVTHNLAIAVCSIRRVYTSNDAATLYNNRFKTISLIICSFRIPSFYLTLASCSFLFGGPFGCPFPLSPPLDLGVFMLLFACCTSLRLHELISPSSYRKVKCPKIIWKLFDEIRCAHIGVGVSVCLRVCLYA